MQSIKQKISLFNQVCLGIDLPISKQLLVIQWTKSLRQPMKSVANPDSAAFTLGELGGGTTWNTGELVEIATLGLRNSRIGQVLIEESILGWQEYECRGYERYCRQCNHCLYYGEYRPNGGSHW